MEDPAASKPPENPPKRRRRSRFASSAPSATQPQPPNNVSTPAVAPSPPPAPAQENPLPNASVAALRARIARSRPPPTPAPDAGAQPSAPKRRRTSRSRFAQAESVQPPQLVPPKTAPNSVPTLPLDVTAIPVAPVSTLRINRDAQQQRKLTSVLKVSASDLLETDPELNPYYDSSIALPTQPTRQPRKELRFVAPGAVVAKAAKKRDQAQVQARVTEYRAKLVSSVNGDSKLPILPPLAEDLRTKDYVPEVPEWEWWDVPFLAKPTEAAAALAKVVVTREHGGDGDSDAMEIEPELELREDRITHYIHHPPPIEPSKPSKPPPVLPLMLTKKETKKLRRQRRMEAQKEQQEMVAVGLLPPPKPKVKLSNLMRVLANEASADPTKVESEVRAQVEERRQKHEAENEARKKTKEERREKSHMKIEKDKEAGLQAAVFRITDMRNPQHRFKVDINARQWEMTGTLLLFSDCNVVVVEGGLKALRKYKKLMLRRMDWDAKVDKSSPQEGNERKNEEVETEEANDRTKKCVLVWEGPISTAAFGEFTTARVRSQRECRYHFRKHGVEHYWDLCTQGTPLGNENLGQRQMD